METHFVAKSCGLLKVEGIVFYQKNINVESSFESKEKHCVLGKKPLSHRFDVECEE